jgi:TolB-like protein/Flp pilus assembly protein TadD
MRSVNPTPQQVREQLGKVLASSEFAGSARMVQFLRFTVEHALAGDTDSLKEYVVALEVFGRDQSYDPRIDSVVRVEARRLRAKLKRYYEGAGRADPVLIQFGQSGYTPKFQLRRATNPLEPSSSHPATIAVLPFRNLSPEPDQDYFCDGLTEEVIHCLAGIPAVRVVAHTSSLLFKDVPIDIREVARRLGVRTVLEGSVRKAGKSLRITAQLIDAASGFHLWSETFDRPDQHVFKIQDDISRRIATTLEIGSPAWTHAAARPHVENDEAYNLYLRGRFQANKQTPAALQGAIDLFRKATAQYPDYALAYVGLAEAYGLLAGQGGMPARDALSLAKDALDHALDLNDALAEAQVLRGGMLGFFEWKHAEAESCFLRAIELEPSYAMAHHWYGMHLTCIGHFDAAENELAQALSLDPLSAHIQTDIAEMLVCKGDFAAAEVRYRQALELDSHYVVALLGLAHALARLERRVEAFDVLGPALDAVASVPFLLGQAGWVLAFLGKKDEAHAVKRRIDELSQAGYVSPFSLIFLHLGLGEPEQVVRLLESAEQERELWISFINVDPRFEPVRQNPKFRQLLKRINLA